MEIKSFKITAPDHTFASIKREIAFCRTVNTEAAGIAYHCNIMLWLCYDYLVSSVYGVPPQKSNVLHLTSSAGYRSPEPISSGSRIFPRGFPISAPWVLKLRRSNEVSFVMNSLLTRKRFSIV